jgi:endonuclease YncB( thermonuclease family)
MARFLAFSFLIGTLACSTSALASQSCTVTAVSDGDTLMALCAGIEYRVRISSVDAPESKQPYGPDAKRFTSDLTRGQVVSIHVQDYDRYGRLVARVTLPDGRDLGRELVRAGLAWHYVKYSRDPELGAIETSARQARVGLWRDPMAQPPSAFRLQQRERSVRSRRSEPRSERRSERRSMRRSHRSEA